MHGGHLFFKLFFDLVDAEAGELAKRHADDRRRLLLGESGGVVGLVVIRFAAAQQVGDLLAGEALHQRFFRVGDRSRGADDMHDLVDMVDGDAQALEDMGAVERLFEVELRPAQDNFLLVVEIVDERIAQRQHLRRVVDDGEHIDRKGVLQLRILEEPVQNDVGVGRLRQLDNDAHAEPVRLVADGGDALDALFLDQIADGFAELGFVDHIGDLGDDNAALSVRFLLDLRARAHLDVAPAGRVSRTDAGHAENDAAGGKIGTLDMGHQLFHIRVGVFKQTDHAVDDLA